jgi:hypothetical protein
MGYLHNTSEPNSDHLKVWTDRVLFYLSLIQRLVGLNGGEGGIRTPDSLTTMPDFESGAFNRALPPLRFVTTYISATCDNIAFCRFGCRTSGVRFGVPLISCLHQLIDSRGPGVSRSKIGIPHDLKRPVPEHFCDGTQMDSGHNQSTCKSMAVAMPRGYPLASSIALGNRPREP